MPGSFSPDGGGEALQSQELEALLRRFEDAWKRGERPDVNDYLPATPGGRRAALAELVPTDLEFRLKAGEAVAVEDYVRRYPELGEPKLLLELIEAEHELRGYYGQPADLEEYQRRFPQYAGDLPDCLATLPSESANTPATGSRLGHFDILGLLGSGSFGLVYRARDRELGRVVALKVPRAGQLLGVRERKRFLREARGTARLNHPGIVPVYEAGTVCGVCYLASEYVPGTTLAELLGRGRLDVRRSGTLAAQTARALAHAHEQGVIHRDLKPANILLGADGLPRITDFGLAKADEEALLTRSGELLGTPAYMSPEQARGEAHRVDVRSDVYSLGVILYEARAGLLRSLP